MTDVYMVTNLLYKFKTGYYCSDVRKRNRRAKSEEEKKRQRKSQHEYYSKNRANPE